MAKRDEFIKKLKKQLDEWNTELNKLEKKVADSAGEAKEKYNKQITELRVKYQEGERKFEKVKSATEETWNDLKEDTENIVGALQEAVKAFKAHFKKEPKSKK